MSNDQLKYKVITRLLAGETAKDISSDEEVTVTYATILRWNRELKEAQQNGNVTDLLDMDQAILGEVIDRVAEDAPPALVEEVTGTLEVIKEASSALDTLKADFILTASNMNLKIRNLALSADNVGEISMLAETLCDLQNAFFNKNSTQVNVQNNYDSNGSNTYSRFLSDKPAELPKNH